MEGVEEGIEKGFEKGIELTIFNAYDHQVDLSLFQAITGQSFDKIQHALKKHGRLKSELG